ncbi:MAG TPA: methyltransferase [Thermoanaerobaculia bacterium]|nr:methyltransferase [Thermoanaerobaculia bacterium]
MTPELTSAADELRRYLDKVGFSQIFKFIVAANLYGVSPSVISVSTSADTARFFDTVLGDVAGLGVLQCLMTGRPVDRATLSEIERPVADALLAAGLLRDDGATIAAAGHQLISAFGLDLLIDRRIHFGGGVHDIYIGPDSYWMLYYVDAASIRRELRAVDLCTGTGIAALYLSLFSDRVVATDIGSVPLALVELNRRLNGREAQVEIRNQDLRDTLDGSERFDVLTCNPPFVAFPAGLQGSLYAQGTDVDGLGYMRTIIERLPSVMNPGGVAYLVADLVGDKARPYFVDELEAYAGSSGLAIDVYIDNVIPAGVQIEPLSVYLALLNHGRNRAEIAAELERFQRETLRAERYYMSTLRLRTAAPHPGVRVLRRYEPQTEKVREPWPLLLQQTE